MSLRAMPRSRRMASSALASQRTCLPVAPGLRRHLGGLGQQAERGEHRPGEPVDRRPVGSTRPEAAGGVWAETDQGHIASPSGDDGTSLRHGSPARISAPAISFQCRRHPVAAPAPFRFRGPAGRARVWGDHTAFRVKLPFAERAATQIFVSRYELPGGRRPGGRPPHAPWPGLVPAMTQGDWQPHSKWAPDHG